MTIPPILPVIGADRPPQAPPVVTLTGGILQQALIQADLVTALTLRGVSLISLAITAQGVSLSVLSGQTRKDITVANGWRGMGHLTSYPADYLTALVDDAINPQGTSGGDGPVVVQGKPT